MDLSPPPVINYVLHKANRQAPGTEHRQSHMTVKSHMRSRYYRAASHTSNTSMTDHQHQSPPALSHLEALHQVQGIHILLVAEVRLLAPRWQRVVTRSAAMAVANLGASGCDVDCPSCRWGGSCTRGTCT
jgi:hypothetical protein